MPAFPYWDIGQPRNSTSPQTRIPQVQADTESGFSISRRKYTGVLHTMTVTYVCNAHQRTALERFFNLYQGTVFDYYHRDMNAVYPARFLSDALSLSELTFDAQLQQTYEVSFDLEVLAPANFTIYTDPSGANGSVNPPSQSAERVYYFYLSNSIAAPVSPAVRGADWHQSTSKINGGTTQINRRKLIKESQIASDGDGLALVDFGDGSYPQPTTNDLNWMWAQFVSDQLQAQTISGNIVGQLQATDSVGLLETSPGLHEGIYVSMVLRLVDVSGNHKALLLSAHGLNYFEIPGTQYDPAIFYNLKTPQSVAMTSALAAAGDRLVLEIGVHRPDVEGGGIGIGDSEAYIRARFGSKISGTTSRLPIDNGSTDNNKVPFLYLENGVLI